MSVTFWWEGRESGRVVRCGAGRAVWKRLEVGKTAGESPLGEGVQQPWHADEIDHALQIVGQHGQAEFAAHLGESLE